MRFTLELRDKKYESAKFADRHFFGFMAAIGGTTGLSLLEILNEQFSAEYPNADQFTNGVLKSYTSLQKAEEDLQYLLKRVLPSLTIDADDLDTEDFLSIVTQMGTAYASSKSTPIESASTPTPTPTPEPIDPPVLADLSDSELDAIEAVSTTLYEPYQVIECWYQWWRSIVDVGTFDIEDGDAFDIIADFTKGGFSIERSTRIYAALKPHLQALPEPIAEPIAA